MKEEVTRHFSNKFVEAEEARPLLDGIVFHRISGEDSEWLEIPFQGEDIKDAIKSLGISYVIC